MRSSPRNHILRTFRKMNPDSDTTCKDVKVASLDEIADNLPLFDGERMTEPVLFATMRLRFYRLIICHKLLQAFLQLLS